MAQSFSGSLSEWLFLCRERGFGKSKKAARRVSAPATKPDAVKVEYVCFSADAHGHIVPIAHSETCPVGALTTSGAAARWIRLRAGVRPAST